MELRRGTRGTEWPTSRSLTSWDKLRRVSMIAARSTIAGFSKFMTMSADGNSFKSVKIFGKMHSETVQNGLHTMHYIYYKQQNAGKV